MDLLYTRAYTYVHSFESLAVGEGCSLCVLAVVWSERGHGSEVVDECRQSIFVLNEVSRNRGHPQEIS